MYVWYVCMHIYIYNRDKFRCCMTWSSSLRLWRGIDAWEESGAKQKLGDDRSREVACSLVMFVWNQKWDIVGLLQSRIIIPLVPWFSLLLLIKNRVEWVDEKSLGESGLVLSGTTAALARWMWIPSPRRWLSTTRRSPGREHDRWITKPIILVESDMFMITWRWLVVSLLNI